MSFRIPLLALPEQLPIIGQVPDVYGFAMFIWMMVSAICLLGAFTSFMCRRDGQWEDSRWVAKQTGYWLIASLILMVTANYVALGIFIGLLLAAILSPLAVAGWIFYVLRVTRNHA